MVNADVNQGLGTLSARRIVASYLILQAIGTATWWVVLFVYPASIDWFKPAAWPPETLLGFWLGDFALVIAGSLMTAYATLTHRPWSTIAVWSLTAAVWYPTL